MPNMADITVKNAAGTDVVYTAAMPSAGDKSPARWMQNLASAVVAFRPKFDILTRSNASGDVRRIEYSYSYPIVVTDPVTTRPKLLTTITGSGVFFLPANADSSETNEAFVQLGNLMTSALVRAVAQTGYAPT